MLAGDERTGVDLMAVEEGLDTGGVYDRWETAIGPDDTVADLRTRLAAAGADLLVTNLTKGLGEPAPQVGEPTYAHKLDPAELHVDWSRPGARRAPPGAGRRRLDHARGRPAQAVGAPRSTSGPRQRGRPQPATGRSTCWRSSPRAQADAGGRAGPTAPTGSPATGSGT